MARMINDKAAASSFQRTLAERATDDGPREASDSVARALAGRDRGGWDPWEVWLRRIEQPRRRQAERRRA
jgi:hypothetical protein